MWFCYGEAFWSVPKWRTTIWFAMISLSKKGFDLRDQKYKNPWKWGVYDRDYGIRRISWGFCGGGVPSLNRRNLIVDIDYELRWYICKERVLRDFLKSVRKGLSLDIGGWLRGAVWDMRFYHFYGQARSFFKIKVGEVLAFNGTFQNKNRLFSKIKIKLFKIKWFLIELRLLKIAVALFWSREHFYFFRRPYFSFFRSTPLSLKN